MCILRASYTSYEVAVSARQKSFYLAVTATCSSSDRQRSPQHLAVTAASNRSCNGLINIEFYYYRTYAITVDQLTMESYATHQAGKRGAICGYSSELGILGLAGVVNIDSSHAVPLSTVVQLSPNKKTGVKRR